MVEWQTGQIARVSVASGREQANGSSYYPSSLSADGRLVVFSSTATNLVPDDTSDTTDIFLHDQHTGETMRLSVAADGTEANDLSNWPSIASNGRFVTFSSEASNLVPGDTNNVRDIFIVDPECLPQQPTPTPTAEVTPTEEATPEATPTEETTPEITPEVTPTEEITPEVTPTEEVTPDVTPTEEITPQVTPTEEVTPEVTPTAAPTSPPSAVPQRNYITTQPITLTWNPVTWAVGYQVQVDRATTFSNAPMDAATPELQLSTLDPGTYFWRVRAVRANGTPGAWSKVESFTVGMQ
jgi:hypothetical protein